MVDGMVDNGTINPNLSSASPQLYFDNGVQVSRYGRRIKRSSKLCHSGFEGSIHDERLMGKELFKGTNASPASSSVRAHTLGPKTGINDRID